MTRTAARRRGVRLAMLSASLAVAIAWSRPAAGQGCIGDCRVEGRVTIADLILAVNIVLGIASLDDCPAIGPAPVTVARLIASVNNALCDCAPCPTAPPTATPTATSPPVASRTPTATPTVGPMVSEWEEDDGQLTSSNCRRDITDAIRSALLSDVSHYTVRQQDGLVNVADRDGVMYDGTVDAQGIAHVMTTLSQSQGSCMVTLGVMFAVDLTRSPTTANYNLTVRATGCPAGANCMVRLNRRWTRQ